MAQAKKVIRRRREKKNIERGQVHIRSSFNTYRIPELVVGSEFGICKAGNFQFFY